MNKVLTSGIFFLTAERVAAVANPEILNISYLKSLIVALRSAVVAKLVISGISSSHYNSFC